MSRLYLKVLSDTHQTTKTMTGNQSMDIEVRWGSKKDSKPMFKIEIDWNLDSQFPMFTIKHGKDFENPIYVTSQREMRLKR